MRNITIITLVLAIWGCGGSPDLTPDRVTVLPPPKEACAPGNDSIVVAGGATTNDAKSYLAIPFAVDAATNRIEVSYQWVDRQGPPGTPLTGTTFDLGLWDQRGYRADQAFRGWSGSREGRIDQDDDPVFVEAGTAARGYMPGEILPGTWYVDLGIAALAPNGSDWEVHIQCLDTGSTVEQVDNPVDPAHVANAAAGWYHADFHMHAYHSSGNAPDNDDFIAQARVGKVDILGVSEYVTGQHWRELGAVQQAHPDLLIWPGREIITYFGHANTFGETADVLEYRHGFEDVSIADIQERSVAAGALFQVNHPETFRGAAFENLCRGCAFELGDDIDWSKVHLIEVVNSATLASSSQVGLPAAPGFIENPFTRPAIQLWDEKINQGFRITAVSGSDSKGDNPEADRWRAGYGSSVTAIYAQQLSRPAVTTALREGNAYIRLLGVDRSPALEVSATANAVEIPLGGTLTAANAVLTVNVTGGNGQTLRFFRDGVEQAAMRTVLLSDDQTVVQNIATDIGSGPLGTAWRVETVLPQGNYPELGGLIASDVTTTLANPVFLKP